MIPSPFLGQKVVQPQTSLQAVTNALVAAVTYGKGLKVPQPQTGTMPSAQPQISGGRTGGISYVRPGVHILYCNGAFKYW